MEDRRTTLRASRRELRPCPTGGSAVVRARRRFRLRVGDSTSRVSSWVREGLAQRARVRLAGYPVVVEVASFESWGARGRRFDLVYAATAWHWIDPAVACCKAHGLLERGGHLAYWSAGHAFPAGFDPFLHRDPGRLRVDRRGSGGRVAASSTDRMPTDVAEIEASRLFEDVEVRATSGK